MENEKTVGDQKLPHLYQHFTVNSLLHEIMNIQMISRPGISPRLTEATQKGSSCIVVGEEPFRQIKSLIEIGPGRFGKGISIAEQNSNT